MDAANEAFYLISDKIIELQQFFINISNVIARVVLLLAILMAAVNYALTGTGLKENIIKIGKAFVFFSIVIFFYPNIVSWITDVTFQLAYGSTYDGKLLTVVRTNAVQIKETAIEIKESNGRFVQEAYAANEDLKNLKTNMKPAAALYEDIFSKLTNTRTFTNSNGRNYSYSTVVPSAALEAVFLVAADCFFYANRQSVFQLAGLIKGVVTGFFVILVGAFCIIEYLIAFIEFMLVSSVGVILFPLSLWDGTKFIAEKFIGAMLGFFVKLLFSTICIFLMLYSFMSLANQYTNHSFIAEAEQILPLIFVSLLSFYICKSAPALAQSLLSGSPSLTGAGAIGMVASSVAAVTRLAGMAGGSGMASPQIPASHTAAVTSGSGGASIVSQTPPPFIASQSAAGLIAPPPAPQQERIALEDRTGDLTRSLTYANRPLIEGPGGAAAVIPPPVTYYPAGRQQALSFGGYSGDNRGKPSQGKINKEKPAGSEVTYQVL